jgi:glycosyltransferase involved in cell wall biosynthesis
VVSELDAFTRPYLTTDGHEVQVTEVLLVHDGGPDDSPVVMRELAAQFPWLRTLWLSRNFGQHAATLAGIASSGGDWVVTMDEDGQHDPGFIGDMVDTAMREQRSLVYAAPTNPPPHGWLRNTASRGAKKVIEVLAGGTDTSKYQSFRLILGEVARMTAAFAGAGVYLDVALGWVAGEAAVCPVRSRQELGRASGYSMRRLLSHFWRMVLTSGTRGLRVVSALGITFSVLGVALAIGLAITRLAGNELPEGWTSTIVVVLVSTGSVLFSLGVIAEYVGVAVNMALGKPAYLLTSDPSVGPLGRRRASR